MAYLGNTQTYNHDNDEIWQTRLSQDAHCGSSSDRLRKDHDYINVTIILAPNRRVCGAALYALARLLRFDVGNKIRAAVTAGARRQGPSPNLRGMFWRRRYPALKVPTTKCPVNGRFSLDKLGPTFQSLFARVVTGDKGSNRRLDGRNIQQRSEIHPGISEDI